MKGQLAETTFELLGKARALAGDGGEVIALLGGHGHKDLAAQLGAADKVIYADHPALEQFNPQAWCKAVTQMLQGRLPGLVLVSYSSQGMDLASGVGTALDVPVLAYATDVQADGGRITVTSQLYGGKIMAESAVNGDSAIVAMLAGVAPADAGRAEGSPAVEEVSLEGLDALQVTFKELVEPEGGDVDITKADVIVSVGRGIQSEENIEMAEALAQKLGGVVAASRPIVDAKWLPKSRQVGKSGLKVKPKLYIALGISGAPEHIEGMKDSETIIAINSDPKAPIFEYAHYGVAEDLFDVVPALTEKL